MKKKLIEVALPLEAINKASAREKSIRHGHPSTLHLWWARRPLAAARAVIFAQMVDDPSAHPEEFPTEEAQEKERQRLFRLIEELVQWENTTNETVLAQAREEIWKSWRRTCREQEAGSKEQKGGSTEQGARSEEEGDASSILASSSTLPASLFDPNKLPAFHDPFAGGGSLPLEAQRLGLESYASDLNPVAVLINKAMIEVPPKFAGQPPVNPEARHASRSSLLASSYRGAQGLAEDVRYYGKWLRDEAEKRIGHLYPKVEITADMAKERPDLKPLVGGKLTVIAWLWARTVKSPNPAFAHVYVPLVSTFMLSTKVGKEAYIEPVIDEAWSREQEARSKGQVSDIPTSRSPLPAPSPYRFMVKVGRSKDAEAAKNGTKLARGNFRCLLSGTPISSDYIKIEGQAGRMGARMIAVVAEGKREHVYLPPTDDMEAVAREVQPDWAPDVEFFQQALGFRVGNYGMTKWSDLFTPRQTMALEIFSRVLDEAHEHIQRDGVAAGLPVDDKCLAAAGTGAGAYADAVAIYLACGISRACDYWNSNATWESGGGFVAHAFTRNAIPMVWNFAESNPFSSSGGNWASTCMEWVERVIRTFSGANGGMAVLADAQTQSVSVGKIVSTDPPYYDNVGYADLSDFFYVWLRRSLRSVVPDLFATLIVPKTEELVATPERHGGKKKAETFFLDGMTQAMHRLAEQVHPAFPVTIYYAFKQSESDEESGISSTGWETFLGAVISAGFAIHGTWPLRTERAARSRGIGSNALASSIVLVCRPRSPYATPATRREFVTALKADLSVALAHLERGNIAPVDLAQAAIGPGMAVYTRYDKVLDAEGNPVSIREALALINQTLDEVLAEQEGDFDADSRWALSWFEQFGFADGEYGVAETLSKAKNTSVGGMVEAGIAASIRWQGAIVKARRTTGQLGPDDRHSPHGMGDGAPLGACAGTGRNCCCGAGSEARNQVQHCPRTCLPALYRL
jgi:putative DNA methylase